MAADTVLTFAASEMDTEREARLLETGAYPDKNLTLAEDDLDAIVARFGETPTPVKVEHVDSPLDPVGEVRSVWRQGKALMGRLAFPADLAAFLHRRGIQKLSVGLSRDPLGLSEVSLVLKPRIASATLMSETEQTAEIGRLRRELAAQTVDAQISKFKAEGRLLPASESLARELLLADDSAIVAFADGQTASVSETFARFLSAQPPVICFGETARAGEMGTSEAARWTPDEEAFLRDRLRVDPAKVGKETGL